jgi:glutamate N-acetyltransferase/amino-acid N-acetyltransferase
VEVDRLELRMNGVVVFAGGEPTDAEVALESTTCRIELDLGLGTGGATYLASDLTYDYVRINAEYTT